MSSNASNKHEIIEQAAAWHARLSADDVSAQDWRDFQAWLDQDAPHRDVFESIERMSGMLSSLGEEPRLRALHDSAPSMASESEDSRVVPLRTRTRTWDLRPRHMALAASVLVAVIIPLLYFMGSEQVPEATIYETAVGERRGIELDDGSSLTLNADSSIAVTMTEDEREVRLRNGDLFLEVSVDTDRPLSVEVGDYRVTVTGTAFDVRYRTDPATVIVHEGRVLVASDDDAGSATELHAGQQLILKAGATAIDLGPEELSNVSDWRNGWLHFDDHSLAAVVSELEPYLDKRVVLTSRKVEALKVGGSFNVDNVDSMFTALESLLPVVVTREQDRIIIDHESDATHR